MPPATERCPGEFLYWENVGKPVPRLARALVRHTTGLDLTPSPEHLEQFAASYYDADPLAEAFVRDVVEPLGYERARTMLDDALAHGSKAVVDAPGALLDLFADLDEDPDWVDWNEVELGARVFRRFGSLVFKFAGAITLQAYSENSVAKALILAGGYEGETTRNRFLETASFWIDVSEPRAMRRGGRGRNTAMRVRIMHVFVRRRIREHPEWDEEAWGVPISQGDAVLTLMGGSAVPGALMQVLGFRPTKEEILALMHFWRYVGHVMGVRPRWYPANLEEAAQLLFANLVKGANGAGDDGKRLCQSFASAFVPPAGLPLRKRLGARIEHRLHMAFTQFFSLPRFYRRNEIPGTGLLSLYPLLGFPLLFGAETLRRHSRVLDDVADRVARRERRRWLDRRNAGRHASYVPPSSLSR